MNALFLERIHNKEDFESFAKDVVQNYDLGKLIKFKILEIGYEDFNAIITSSKGKFFLKVFATYRTQEEVLRYVGIMDRVVNEGVNHPKLLKNNEGEVLSQFNDDHYVLLEYIEAQDLYHGGISLNHGDIQDLIRQAAIINSLDIKVPYYYDSWSILNVENEFNKFKHLLSKSDIALCEPVINRVVAEISFESLPQAFIHGDLTLTNLMKTNGKVYILDFSVANNAPRIQELGVLLSNTILAQSNSGSPYNAITAVIESYNLYTQLTEEEKSLLPLYTQACLITNIIGTSKAMNEGNNTKETIFWLDLGRKGLNLNW